MSLLNSLNLERPYMDSEKISEGLKPTLSATCVGRSLEFLHLFAAKLSQSRTFARVRAAVRENCEKLQNGT